MNTIEAMSWGFGYACNLLEKDIDPRKYELPKVLEDFLTTTPAEDECICNLDPDDTCPVKIFNEDCPIHGYEYEEVDGWVICPDCGREIHLPFPSETQITRLKIEEFWTTHKDKFNEYWRISPGEVIAEIRRWLQQEDK